MSGEDDESPVVDAQQQQNVQVAVRIRPLLAREAEQDICLQVYNDGTQLQVGGSQGPRFTFDQVLDRKTTQLEFYESRVVHLVNRCLEGYNATILAYGQTGSGKTYTILGESTNPNDPHAGVIPRAVTDLFAKLQGSFQVKLQFLELYGEEIRDLLTTQSHQLTIREISEEPEVVGATQQVVQTPQEALMSLKHGMLRRVTGATAMNESSSRSHAILSILIEQQFVIHTNTSEEEDEEEEVVQVKRSRFNFVDLAGSERVKRTHAEGQRLKEGIDINKGLLVLGNVISALGDPKKVGKTFVPYRDSKLTRLLKGSLGGNHKTLMIACVSPAYDSIDESINCLRYANRAKNIQNNAIVNVDANSRLLSQLQAQVQALATDLLRAVDDGHECGFSRETLESLVSGEQSSAHGMAAVATTTSPLRSAGSTPQKELALESKLKSVESEVNRLRDLLRETQAHQDAAEEELYVTKAEKELYQLQMSVSKDENVNEENGAVTFDQAFLQRAKEYEAEIGRLKVALRDAEAKTKAFWETNEDQAIARAKETLKEDRRKLETLAAREPATSNGDRTGETPANVIEGEEHSEEAELNLLTKKFLGNDHDSDDEEGGDEHVEAPKEEGESSLLRADLVELSRSIAAKEDLIDQLQLSQEKYSRMRDFYEERLQQMEVTLNEKEKERQDLLLELDRSKGGTDDEKKKELELRLRDKENHIVNLRKKQRELMNLTKVSARNSEDINRLRAEVRSMKRKKVDLQKQLGEERRQHIKEKRDMEKETMQKEREVNKWKKVSTQREVQAEKAQQVAKARLEEIGHLRSKYKDAEKKIRLLSVKRGVMAKAGLDPVIVGRRETSKAGVQQQGGGKRKTVVDTEAMREHFDKKVAEVVRKEAIVDKLAHEWEDHFELSQKRQELVGSKDEASKDAIQSLDIQIGFKEDRIRQLAQRLAKPEDGGKTKIQRKSQTFLFDEEFKKLCSEATSETSKETAAKVLFGMVVRERRRVAALARTASSLDERAQAAERTAVHNEEALRSYMNEQRRELAALTQSQQEQILSLMDFVRDESGHSETDEALLAEKPHFGPKLLVLANERIALLERQIESLREEAQTAESYRIQLEDLQDEVKRRADENDDFQEDLSGLRGVLRQIRELLVNAGHHGEGGDSSDHTSVAILETINDALHPRSKSSSSKPRRVQTKGAGRGPKLLSPRVKKHIELMHSSDSEDVEAPPEWANEIMTDLALIADGKVPPSLEGSVTFDEHAADLATFGSPIRTKSAGNEEKSPLRLGRKSKSSLDGEMKSPGKQGRRAMSKGIEEKLSQIADPLLGDPVATVEGVTVSTPSSFDTESKSASTGEKEYKSVFDRLISPSQYTGTHKEKYQAKKTTTKRQKNKDADAATQLLDDLLQSDSEQARQAHERATQRANLSEYTQQDVFERLTKTTTAAYAVRHNGTMLPDAHMDHITPTAAATRTGGTAGTLKDEGSAATAPTTSGSHDRAEYTSQDVFERLTKTTTEAYAKRTTAARHEH